MTRRPTCFTLVVASALLLNGCGPVASFFPLYKSDDKVIEPGLVGVWKLAEPDPNNPDEKNERWAFVKAGDEISYQSKIGCSCN